LSALRGISKDFKKICFSLFRSNIPSQKWCKIYYHNSCLLLHELEQMDQIMEKSWFGYISVILGFCLMIFFSFVTYPFLITKPPMGLRALQKSNNTEIKFSNTCKHHYEFQVNAPKNEFKIQIHEKLRNCLQPENDSRQLSVTLDFLRRPK
jgi:hypothetical protein